MDDIIYLDIYKEVNKNKGFYSQKSEEYFDTVVKKQWVDNDRKKLADIEYHEVASFLGGSDLCNRSLYWFMGTDLVNCDKYIWRASFSNWKNSGFKLLEFDKKVELEGEWGVIPIIDIAKNTLNNGGWIDGRLMIMSKTIIDLVKISAISDLFADGYHEWVGKHKKAELLIPDVISNKMQFILWKRAISKSKMSEKHFKNLTRCQFGKWGMEAYNELYKVNGLKEKRYFQNQIEKTWFRDVKNCNFEMAKIKIEHLAKYKYNKSTDWQENQVLNYVENVDLDTSDLTGREFVDWVVQSGVLDRVRFKERENSYFKKELFVKHLEGIYIEKK